MSAVPAFATDETDLPHPPQHGHVFLHRHAHEWVLNGAHRTRHWDGKGYSEWHPTYKCSVCGDVIAGSTKWRGSVLRLRGDRYVKARAVR